MKNKLLTIDDLTNFCKEQKLRAFDAEKEGYPLRVQIPAQFAIDKEVKDEKTLFAYIQVMHTGVNRNKSSFTDEAAEECMSSLAYKPLLADFTDINGELDFTTHAFTIDDNGEIEYQERQVGCFTADKPYMKDDEEHEGRKNVYAKVAIPREYTKAAEIIERKDGTKVSVEVDINKMAFDGRSKIMTIESAEIIGCTLLGVSPKDGSEIAEGMENAHIQLEDFSAENNAMTFFLDENIVKIIKDSVKEAFNDIQYSQGKEEDVQMNHFEELLQKYGKTVEEVTFEYDGLTDEELDAKFAELFGEVEASEEAVETATEAEAESAETEESTEDNAEAEVNEAEVVPEENSLKMSVNIDGVTKEFSISLVGKLNALYNLVNATYGETDNDFYDVDAYDDDKIVIMHGMMSGRHFKQSYNVKKDVFSLKGDRCECFAQYLTEDEIKQLDNMKQNYAETAEKLAKFEGEPEKMAVLESEEYSDIAETEEFQALKAVENHFDLTVDEIRTKADEIMLSYAKAHKLGFSAQINNSDSGVSMKVVPIIDKKAVVGRYGRTFS